MELPTSEEIRAYVADFREFLEKGTFPERKALIRNFVQGIKVSGDEAELRYTIPMPAGGVTSERATVLDFVQSGPPAVIRTAPQGSALAWGRVALTTIRGTLRTRAPGTTWRTPFRTTAASYPCSFNGSGHLDVLDQGRLDHALGPSGGTSLRASGA